VEGQERNTAQLERIGAMIEWRWGLKKESWDVKEESKEESRDKEEKFKDGPRESQKEIEE